jgi:uncharacterized membrane protein (DUF4010 family)
MEFLQQIPDVLINLLITVALSILIGFDQRKRIEDKSGKKAAPAFGSDRTFAFIGALGFILYIISPENLFLFIAGAVLLTALLGIFYYAKITENKTYGLTSTVIALITYSIGPVVATQPRWLPVLIVVMVLILVDSKGNFKKLSEKLSIDEFTTLAKFLLVAFVILPIVPREPVIPVINFSAYTIWLTVVVVSGISYASYLLQTFFFKKSGVLITGLLGGLYSSTATTVIISKRSKELGSGAGIYPASIILANAMMYLRILVLMFIFNLPLAMKMLPYMLILSAAALVLSAMLYFFNRIGTRKKGAKESAGVKDSAGAISAGDDSNSKGANPLELKVAIMFAGLFIIFSMVTQYTISHFGLAGLDILSFITGITDIDPFLLNLFEGKYEIPLESIGRATLQAIISNNILKSIYIFWFAESGVKKSAGIAMGILTALTLVFAIIVGMQG